MMGGRQTFPNRRGSVRFSFTHAGRLYSATLSKFADGRLGEIFIDEDKPDFELAVHANDAAVLASLLLPAWRDGRHDQALDCRSVGDCARPRRGRPEPTCWTGRASHDRALAVVECLQRRTRMSLASSSIGAAAASRRTTSTRSRSAFLRPSKRLSTRCSQKRGSHHAHG